MYKMCCFHPPSLCVEWVRSDGRMITLFFTVQLQQYELYVLVQTGLFFNCVTCHLEKTNSKLPAFTLAAVQFNLTSKTGVLSIFIVTSSHCSKIELKYPPYKCCYLALVASFGTSVTWTYIDITETIFLIVGEFFAFKGHLLVQLTNLLAY